MTAILSVMHRSLGPARLMLALVLVLSIAGFVVTRHGVDQEREREATRRAQLDSVHTQQLLQNARAYVVGLGNALGGEPVPSARRFAQLQGTAAGSVGLTEAMWVDRALRVRYATGTRDIPPELQAALQGPVFAVAATPPTAFAGQRGFFLAQAARFGDDRGYLVVFVPRGWLTVGLQDDPRLVAIDIDSRPLEGRLEEPAAASSTFDALARTWGVAVAAEPSSGLDATLPWLALGWPLAIAAIVYALLHGLLRRRRAEREVERIFDLSVDLLCVANTDGYFVRVNPAFERVLGYPSDELLRRPFVDFVHPDDVAATRAALAALARGQALSRFENRYMKADGSACWLEWSVRPVAAEGLIYATARDVTSNRRVQAELTASRARIVEAADETRRRIERDLHDGTQQRLISLALALRTTESKLPPEFHAELARVADGLNAAVEELQEISRGIHPAILARGGLGPALKALARRSALPVELDVQRTGELPRQVEVAAYYVVSEALNNAVKHAHATHVRVQLGDDGDAIRLVVTDDGDGGADASRGSGLIGLSDRVAALGGTLDVDSRPGGGTTLTARIPSS
jgi:PAS domain S-box-containing protein